MKQRSGPNSGEEIVQLENAHKIYRMGTQDVKALDGITVSFARGRFWAIMGPSGSGKSTMMNILGCLDRLTSGRYILEGRDVSTFDDDSLSELRLRHLGFIFQSFNLIISEYFFKSIFTWINNQCHIFHLILPVDNYLCI